MKYEFNGSCKFCMNRSYYCHVQAIANLSVDSKVAKAVSENGGIDILADLARSTNRLVAEEVVGGLWNLSVGEDHKVLKNEAF